MRGAAALEQRLSRVAVGGALVLLAAVGLGTAGALHLHAVADLDRLLLVAAQAGAGTSGETAGWVNGHHAPPVEVWEWAPGDGRVAEARAREAFASEAPVRETVGGRRRLLLAVEPPGADCPPGPAWGHAHPRALRVAEAPAEQPAQTVGVFLAVYAAVAGAAGALGAWVLPRRVRRALGPLRDAEAQLAAVPGLGAGTRLPVEGPAEVAAVLRSVNALLDRLDAAVQAQSRFTADAAHELRTPVTVLRGELELALRKPRDAAGYRAALAAALAQVERLGGLVEGLMALARLDAGGVQEEGAPLRLSAVAHAALRRESARLEAAGNRVELRVEADPELRGHGALLELTAANLLRNAAVHAPGTAVRVTVGVGPAGAELRVEDGGAGVPAARREAVFARFAREDRRREGLGLGLALAREVARHHGGDVVLEDAPGGGLRARLVVPASQQVPR